MKVSRHIGWISAAFLAASWSASLHAQSASTGATRAAPGAVEKSRDGIEYLSGGIGINSQEEINARAKDFNLKLVFTLNEGNYVADVGVALKDARGRTVVDDTAGGPFFLAKLPAGQYTVAATYEGRTVTRKVQVGKGLRTEYLRWPSNPENDNPLPREQAASHQN
jgi:hypothetical protein